MNYDKELKVALEAAYKAMEVIMEVYSRPFDVEIKDDDSPVTEADKKSDLMIRQLISENFPHHTFLTEEGADDKKRLDAEYVWIIDPLDGTKDFVDHDDEFAVNIALVRNHLPVLGVVAVPVTGVIYYAVRGEGAYVIYDRGIDPVRIHVSDRIQDLTLLSSVYHENEDEKQLAVMFKDRITTTLHVGSAIKACLIASGKAEVSFRFNPNTKEWDTCAPQIVVEEAGGIFCEPDGTPIRYNRQDVYNRKGFSIYNRPENNFSKIYLNTKKQ